MKASDRRALYKSTVRADILDAARNIFAQQGYDALTIRVLAKRIGFSPAAIYKHFKNKDEIFSCLVEESFATLSEASSKVSSIENEDPLDRLKRGMWVYVNFGLANPDNYRLAFLLGTQPSKRPEPTSRAAYVGLRSRVQKCVDAGRFLSSDVELISQVIWTALHGVIALLIQRPSFPWVSRKKLISQLIDSLLKGLGK